MLLKEKFKDEVAKLVGTENITEDPRILEKYSRDQSFTRHCMPSYVVWVQSAEQVQGVVRIANRHQIPITPRSSGMSLAGATIPDHGGIVLDLSRMNKIVSLDRRQRFVVVEPGVTFAQLQDELIKHDLRAMAPLGVPPTRSVITSIVEGEPALAAASFEYGNALSMDQEMVLPTGEVFRLGRGAVLRRGKWSAMGGQQGGASVQMYWLVWRGAQGTLGVTTKLAVKVGIFPRASKIFFVPFSTIEDAIEPIRRIQRKEIGMESFMLNNFSLAAICAKDWTLPDRFPWEREESAEFEVLRGKLPNWSFIIHLCGFTYLPEEKVAYEEETLREICKEVGVVPVNTLAEIAGLGDTILKELIRPWGILKKARYKGSFHPIAFYSTLRNIPGLERIVHELANEHGYPLKDVGGFILPIERGRSFYCEFDFHCDLSDPKETEDVKKLWLESAETLAGEKGLVMAKPYGPLSPIIYRRIDPIYIEKLRQLKREFDPSNVMNPGKLCF